MRLGVREIIFQRHTLFFCVCLCVCRGMVLIVTWGLLFVVRNGSRSAVKITEVVHNGV